MLSTKTVDGAETDREHGVAAGACRTVVGRISSSVRRPREPVPPKCVFAGYALPPGLRIPPAEYRALSTERLRRHTARTRQGLVSGRVRATPIWRPHYSPEQRCPASAIFRGPGGSEAHYRRAEAGWRQTGPIPFAGYSIAAAAPLPQPLSPVPG